MSRSCLVPATRILAGVVGFVVLATGTALAGTGARRPAAPVLYVANFQSGTVSRIDTAAGRAERPVVLGRRSGPSALVTVRSRRILYVAEFGSGMVTPVRTATRRAGRPIPVGAGPLALTLVR
jgi:DNA-binding beta-propeller fold protein YncE